MASCSDVYLAVWNHAVSRGAYVHYDRKLTDGRCGLFHPNETVGRPPEPKIHISGTPGGGLPRREGAPFRHGTSPLLDRLTEPEIAAELCVLAHEVGHFQSWLSASDGGNDTRAIDVEMRTALIRRDEIFDAMQKATPDTVSDDEFKRLVNAKLQLELTDAQRRMILDEEKRAWALGRALLVEFGLADLGLYDARADASLSTYRAELGVD